jgi:peptidoglycan/LPS O-acetylase OafA/YrhL
MVIVDYITGISFAAVLYFVIHNQSPTRGDRYARWSRTVAGFSYTLYLTHLPLLVFLRAAWAPGEPWEFGSRPLAAAGALTALCLGYAYAVARLTEGKTDNVRKYMMRWFTGSQR